MAKEEINFNYKNEAGRFYSDVMRTIIQQPDYKGIGGHNTTKSTTHGNHSQISIGIGSKTVNFRELE